MSKSIKIFIAILSIILVSIIGVSIFYQARRNYKFVDVDSYTRQMYINYLNKQVKSVQKSTKQEIRAMLEDELDFHDYTYKEVDISNGGYAGKFSKIIEINKDLDVETYCFVLCHEMCHLKYESSNEIQTNFMAFKSLYESDNKQLNNIGTWFGIYFLDGNYENDCSKLIVDYLKEQLFKVALF